MDVVKCQLTNWHAFRFRATQRDSARCWALKGSDCGCSRETKLFERLWFSVTACAAKNAGDSAGRRPPLQPHFGL